MPGGTGTVVDGGGDDGVVEVVSGTVGTVVVSGDGGIVVVSSGGTVGSTTCITYANSRTHVGGVTRGGAIRGSVGNDVVVVVDDEPAGVMRGVDAAGLLGSCEGCVDEGSELATNDVLPPLALR